MRSKEDAMDYRYFPDPDLPPLVITREYIDARKIDELPMDRRTKYSSDYHLAEDHEGSEEIMFLYYHDSLRYIRSTRYQDDAKRYQMSHE